MRLVVRVCLFVMLATGAAVAGPLDKPAFTATPAELLAEARATTATGHDVAVLRDEVTYTYDARGRHEARHRMVFTVLAPSGADGWGTITLNWQPFYQDRPTIRARVINRDGSVTEFDPSLVHDAPAVKESPTVFSDQRDLSAPLPRLEVGAVVEEEFVFVDREPLLGAGTVEWIAFARAVPIARKLVTISAPTALRAKVALRGPKMPWKPTTRVVGDRTIVAYDLTNVAAMEDSQGATPVDWVWTPLLGIATGASWAAIAADYRALVEAKLAAPVTVPPDLIAATPRATVDRILAWLHGRVRYTGIELSQSAIVPFTPAETLARGFGDCKDKATLLVALLRAAKIPADVALLSTGPGLDVDVALPGMGPFDHAIVRARVDGKDLWIDATEELLPAGQLPVRDQGRRALIIAAGTKALTTTPQSAPADNLVREVRTFHLSEHGPATVTEVSEERGIWSDNLRSFVRNSTKDEVAKSLATYTEKEYDGTYRSFTSTDATDVSTPFVVTLEADDVKYSNADRDEVWAWLSPYDALAKVPGTFTDNDAEFERVIKERKVDYLWSVPHVYEVVNRFEVPVGYVTPELPASETRALGAMTLTTTRGFAAGVYTVTYRLDTGKLQITADQVRATRAAVRALGEEERSQVRFTLEATRLADQGKVRESIAAIQKLVALHPKEALHHTQLAVRFQQLGLGEAALRETKLAIALEPKNGDAWMVHGHTLARDLTGRIGSIGNDRPAALAALRKAIALSPTHIGARDELARLLAMDAAGWVSADRAEHREAVPLLRGLRTEQAADVDARLVFSLAMSDDREGLEALGRELPDGPLRRETLVLAAAMKSGEEAVRVATSLAGARGRDALLDTTLSSLMLMRRYDTARAILPTLTTLPTARRALLTRLQPIDPRRLPARDPQTIVTLLLERIIINKVPKAPWSATTEAALEHEATAIDTRTMPAAVMLDSMVASGVITTRGDAKAGWTITLTLAGNSITLFVALRNQRAYLVGGPNLLPGVGVEIGERLAQDDLPGARAWLTRVLDDPTLTNDSPGVAMALRHRSDLATASKAQLEVLGSMLMSEHAPISALPRLRACTGFTEAADRFDCLRVAIGIAYRQRDWVGAARFAREALAYAGDDVDRLVMLAALASTAPGAAAEVDAAVTAALAKQPDNVLLRRASATVGLATSWAVAAPRFERLTSGATTGAQELNNAAWVHVYYDASPAVARELVERAMQLTQDSTNLRNTYATVLAEDGEPAAAWEQLAQTLKAHVPLAEADWYVLGRIAEQIGQRDDAIALYRRAVRGMAVPGLPTGWDFAQKRLKAMGVTP